MSIYLWTRLPLLLMFLCGYLIYRMLVVSKLTDALVAAGLRRCRGSTHLMMLWIIGLSAALSFFIPNAVTVLTMLPVLKQIQARFRAASSDVTTPLTLSVIYGANIGGMGSLAGSPANLLLIGQLDLFQVAGREQIGFFNWFLWSVPLVAALIVAAWILVCVLVRRETPFPEPMTAVAPPPLSDPQRHALRWFGLFLLFWTLEAVLKGRVPAPHLWEPLVCLLFTTLFCRALMRRPVFPDGAPLLRPAALLTGVPARGLLFLVVLGALILGSRYFELDHRISRFFLTRLGDHIPVQAVVPAIIATVIFLTELFSNTLVSVAFFPIAFFASQAFESSPLVLMIAVSTASTCAFMTPVATPCNALAFGEMKGTSLVRMILSGAVLNIAAVAIMSFWLPLAVPWIYAAA